MGFLGFFRRRAKSASIAKDRLSIIVARERTATRGSPIGGDYLPQLQQELLQVIAKYENIDLDQVAGLARGGVTDEQLKNIKNILRGTDHDE